ncbi:hypothetical protein BH09MYX1_BH09MYX1_11380 [soil metagenome]
MTVARALDEGLTADIAELAGLSKPKARERLESARGNTLVRNLFDDVWPFRDQELARATAACALDHNLRDSICDLTGLERRVVTRRLNAAHGKMLLRTVFGEDWPSAVDFARKVGDNTAAEVLRRPILLARVSEISGIPQGDLKRRFVRVHGNTLVSNVLVKEWPHEEDVEDWDERADDEGEREADAVNPEPRPSAGDYPKRGVPHQSAKVGTERDGNGERLFGRYTVVAKLKPGGTGEVFKVRDETGALRFMKRVRTASQDEKSLRREQQIYNKLVNHDFAHVVPVHRIERDDDYFALVLEFASGGSLDRHVPKGGITATSEVKSIAVEIGLGLQELHALNVVHRDLKPANVLLHGSAWKLADFGISRDVSVHGTTTFKGDHTPGYGAPEQMNRTEADASADVYSFGKVITFLLTSETDPDQIRQPGWQLLVHACTERDPEHRISAAELLRRLKRL